MTKGNENDKSANFMTENKKGPRSRYIKTKSSILYSDKGPLTHDVITCSLHPVFRETENLSEIVSGLHED